MNHLPKLIRPSSATKATDHSIHFSPIQAEVATLEKREAFSRMNSTLQGFSEDEAAGRWAKIGPNVMAAGKHRGWPWRLISATRIPLVILLIVLAAISFATGDAPAGFVMAVW